MMMLLSAALAAAAPAAPSTPPAHQHAPSQHKGMSGHEQMTDCCKCCEEMMAKMHEGHGSAHEDHQNN